MHFLNVYLRSPYFIVHHPDLDLIFLVFIQVIHRFFLEETYFFDLVDLFLDLEYRLLFCLDFILHLGHRGYVILVLQGVSQPLNLLFHVESAYLSIFEFLVLLRYQRIRLIAIQAGDRLWLPHFLFAFLELSESALEPLDKERQLGLQPSIHIVFTHVIPTLLNVKLSRWVN